MSSNDIPFSSDRMNHQVVGSQLCVYDVHKTFIPDNEDEAFAGGLIVYKQRTIRRWMTACYMMWQMPFLM